MKNRYEYPKSKPITRNIESAKTNSKFHRLCECKRIKISPGQRKCFLCENERIKNG